MSCFHPNLMLCSVLADGSLGWKFLGPLNFDFDAFKLGSYSDLENNQFFYTSVPCGRCIGCRLDYTREWSTRMAFELIDCDYKAIFVTLTYNEESVPRLENGVLTLCKADYQSFFKRLRYYFPDKCIRYFLCGEYGSRTLRPHYHAIIYGLTLSDFDDLRYQSCNELKQPFYVSPKFTEIWGKGFTLLSDCSYKTLSYVARYTLKKHYGSDKQLLFGALPEFTVSSRRPGIGMTKAEELVRSGNVFFDYPFSDGVQRLFLPRSFIRNLIKRGDPDLVDILVDLKYNRSVDAASRLRSNLLWINRPYLADLSDKERQFEDRLRRLPERDFERR